MPTPPPDCLLSLLGLSAAGSACFPLPAVVAPLTNDALTASATGLYLDTAEGLLRPPSQGQATSEQFYERLTAARALAVQQVRTALLQRGASAFGKSLYAGQSGILGGLPTNGSLLPAGFPARLQLYTAARRAGAWRIQSLQLYTDVTVANVPVLLDGVQIGTVTTNGPAFAPLTAADGTSAGYLIPLDGQLHTLEAVLPAGVRVKANTLTCGCGNPWVGYVRQNLTGPGGVADVRASGGGFAVQVQEECTEPLDVLCFAAKLDTELAQSLGWAVFYTAAALFVIGLITDSARNRYTSLEPKLLPDMQKLYEEKAEQHLAWLVDPEDGLRRVQHPCYQCQSPAWQGSITKVN